MAKSKRKVVVAYKVVPNEPENCIIVTTENLMAEEHDALIKLVESPAGQEAEDLADAMARTSLPDGRNMLAGFHNTGKMIKARTDEVEMVPNTQTTISLKELNEAIATQRGVTVADLAPKGQGTTTTEPQTQNTEQNVEQTQASEDGVLTDEQLAAQYRSQADAMFKEAKRLREQAEELAPVKKKAKAKTESSV